MNRPPKRTLALVTTVGLIGVVGTAWASGWSQSRVVSTTGQAATLQNLSATVTVAGQLYPGSTLSAVAKVSNPNEFAVTPIRVNDLVVSAAKGGHDNPRCTARSSRIAATVGSDVRIKAGTVGQEIVIGVSMGRGASSACAGSTIKLRFRITGDASRAGSVG